MMGIKVVIHRKNGMKDEVSDSHPTATDARIDSGHLLVQKSDEMGFAEIVGAYAPGKWESFVQEG